MAEKPDYEPIDTTDTWVMESLRHVPRVRHARFDRSSRRIVIELTNGCEFTFASRMGQGLRDATDDELAAVKVTEGGYGIEWEALGVDLELEGLLLGRFGNAAWMEMLGRSGEIA